MFEGAINNLWTVLALFYLVWIYSWAKGHLGSAKLAILFSVIVVYLGFFTIPWMVWIPVLILLLAFFGAGLFEKIPEGEKKPDYLRD